MIYSVSYGALQELGHRSAGKYRICHTEWVIRPDFRDTIIAQQGADSSGGAADVVGICNLEVLLQAVTFSGGEI